MRATLRRRRGGFTIVEMLVAVALTLFILGLFAALIQSAMGGMRDAKGMNAVDGRLRNVAGTLRADLRQVYLANGGTPFSPGKLFTGASYIPTQGFITVEANDRALAQGIDAYGNPVELDFNKVLGLTVARSGTTPEEMFYGRSATLSGSTVGGVDLGTYLDDMWNSPAGRHDKPGNGMVSSRFAEVWWFLRAQDRQHTLTQLGADPMQFANAGGLSNQTPPPINALFNLYRRQLPVLDDDALNQPPLGPVTIPSAGSFFNFFDVSAVREPDLNGGTWTNNIHFNTLEDLSRREFRYGMQPRIVDRRTATPNAFNRDEYTATGMNIGNRLSPFRNLSLFQIVANPLSHIDKTSGTNKTRGVHDYNRHITVANGRDAALFEPWLGRPTLAESAHPSYPLWVAGSSASTDFGGSSGTVPGTSFTYADADANGTLDVLQVPPAAQQRSGDDIILRNVLSMTIKVLEDGAGYAGDTIASNFAYGAGPAITETLGGTTAAQASPLSSPALGQARRHHLDDNTLYGTDPQVWSAEEDDVRQRRPQFVDLGYGYDETTTSGTFPGELGDCDALPGYMWTRTVAAGQGPARPPVNPGGGMGTPDALLAMVAGGESGFNGWVQTNPWVAAFGANQQRGAFGPKDAPFGRPLSFRYAPYSVAGTADYFFGPDGQPGFAAFDDLVTYSPAHNPPDGNGITDDWSQPVAPANLVAEYDPVNPTGTYADVDDLNALDVLNGLANIPGLRGADGVAGIRGQTNGKVVNLFAPGSDDNPFVAVPFREAGQIAIRSNSIDHPWNRLGLNPRNTYDSWSAAPERQVNRRLVSGALAFDVLEGYSNSPYKVVPGTPDPSTGAVPPPTYWLDPGFRPVPYSRPLHAIEVRIRVIETRTNIVREMTVRHAFPR